MGNSSSSSQPAKLPNLIGGTEVEKLKASSQGRRTAEDEENRSTSSPDTPAPTSISKVVKLSLYLEQDQYVFLYGQDLEAKKAQKEEIKKRELELQEKTQKSMSGSKKFTMTPPRLPPPDDVYNMWLCQVKEVVETGGSVTDRKLFCTGNIQDEKYFGTIDFLMNEDLNEKYRIRPMTEQEVTNQINFSKKVGEMIVQKAATGELKGGNAENLAKMFSQKLVRNNFPPFLVQDKKANDEHVRMIKPFIGSGICPVFAEEDQLTAEGFSMATIFSNHYMKELRKFHDE